MTENTNIEPEPKSPAEAFEDLRREVAFMRKVIERMADDQRAAPDYSETLGRMADGLTAASKSLNWLSQRPIIQTTVEEMAQEMSEAGMEARASDQKTIADAAKALKVTSHDLSAWIAIARKADDQEREIWRFSSLAGGAGIIMAVTLTIACLRLFPEYGAAWLLGNDRWEAGEQLMASADPERWAEVREVAHISRDLRQANLACGKEADRTRVNQRCRIVTKAQNRPGQSVTADQKSER